MGKPVLLLGIWLELFFDTTSVEDRRLASSHRSRLRFLSMTNDDSLVVAEICIELPKPFHLESWSKEIQFGFVEYSPGMKLESLNSRQRQTVLKAFDLQM